MIFKIQNKDLLELFWNQIIKRGNVKVIVGNQYSSREKRVAVGNWDVMSAAKIISHLSAKANSNKFNLSLLDPIPHFNWKIHKKETEKIINEWSGCDLIVIGSPDANNATAMIFEKIWKMHGEQRIIIKERNKKQMKQYPDDLKIYFNNETKKIHEACIFKDRCIRKELPGKGNINRQFRRINGLVFKTFDKNNNSNREFVLGTCNWLHLEKDKKLKYLGLGNIIISENPFCLKKCACDKTLEKHKLILINGLTGPTTFDMSTFLCEFKTKENMSSLKRQLVKAIENPGDFYEFVIYTKISENIGESSILDNRKARGLIDFILIRNGKETLYNEDFINVGYHDFYIKRENVESFNHEEDLDPDIQKWMSVRSDLDRFLEARNEFKGMFNYLEKYDKELQKLWRSTPYEKSLFIMIPFRDENDIRYRKIVNAIKSAAKDQGFFAFLAKDLDRMIMPHIWDNIILNMLSAKYGIAVLTGEKSLPLNDNEETIISFSNANVAFEFGFMSSRGINNVLLLTHDNNLISADLQGILYEKFNLNDPEKDVYQKVSNWLQRK